MYDPDDLDKEALQNTIDKVAASEEERQVALEQQERQQQAERAEKFAGQQTAIDEGNQAAAKNAQKAEGLEKFTGMVQGAADKVMDVKESVIDRGQNAGIARGLNGLFTMPERFFDFATGAMQEEKEQTGSYSPGWDPFRGYIDANKAQNWWELGSQIGFQEGVTIGATVLTGGATGLGGTALGRVGLAGVEATMNADVSTENNFSGSIKWAAENPDKAPEWIQEIYQSVEKHAPWLGDGLRHVAINNPLATNEGDDVYTTTFKAVLENMLTEGAGEMLNFLYGSRRADEADIETQNMEQAEHQFRVDTDGLPSNTIDVEAVDVTLDPAGSRPVLPETPGTWRASKNSPTADPGQGKYTSRSQPDQMWARARKMTDNPNDMGTVGSDFTALEIERFANDGGMPIERLNQLAKKLYDSGYYKQAMGNKDWVSGNLEAFRRYSKLIGQDVNNMNPQEYWKNLYKVLGDNPSKWDVDPVIADLVNRDLTSQVRNKGMAALALMDNYDIMDVDGAMQNIAERALLTFAEISRGRKAFSDEILKLPPAARKQALDDFSLEDYGYWSDEVESFFRYIKESPDDEMAQFAAELFSKQGVTTMKDLGHYLRHKFKRGKNAEFRGAKGQKKLMREINVMTMLSQLALPDTLIRAAKGTAEIMGINSAGKLIGAAMTGDVVRGRRALAEFMAFKEVIPDTLQIWKKTRDAWMNKDFSQVGNRYMNKADSAEDLEFDRFYEYEMANGNLGDKVYAQTLQWVRNLNRWQPFSYAFPVLSGIDQTAQVLQANMRARSLAIAEMLDKKPAWSRIDKKDFKEARQNYYRARVDDQGNVDFESDLYLQSLVEQSTLTKSPDGIFGKLDEIVQEYPALGLFYRYMTTKINDLMFDYKMMPGLGLVHKEFIDINKAIRSGDFAGTTKYGITNMDEAVEARNMWMGRSALGGMILYHFMQKKQDNELTGNGTTDWRINQLWSQGGWKPRTITYGNFEIDLTEFSGLGMLIAAASDIADNRKFMGDKWADQGLGQIMLAIAASMTSKEMFQPINDLMRMGEPGMQNRWLASQASSLPGVKWFDKLGKIMMPYAKEITQSLEDQMRSKWQGAELFRDEDDRLQPKQDILYGETLNGWDYVQAAINEVSPVQINIRSDRPGTEILLASGYPRQIITNQYDGINFKDNRTLRDAFNKALSTKGLGKKFENLMNNDPKFRASMEKYQADLANGDVVDNPIQAYYHLGQMNQVINRAKDQAWLEISHMEDVKALEAKRDEERLRERGRMYETSQEQRDTPTVFTMYR